MQTTITVRKLEGRDYPLTWELIRNKPGIYEIFEREEYRIIITPRGYFGFNKKSDDLTAISSATYLDRRFRKITDEEIIITFST